MYDVIIIGKGPAGISAALYTARANLTTLVIGKKNSLLMRAEKIENYYGFAEPVRGENLLAEGEKQARRVGATVIEEEVIAVNQTDCFEVVTNSEIYMSKALLMATGQEYKKLKIKNIVEFEGKGVSYCTTCDGFFYNDRKVGVLGFKDYAIHEALELLAFTKDITIFTNGMDLEVSENFLYKADAFKVNKKPIVGLLGSGFLEKVSFADGTNEDIDGIFVAYETASYTDFARKLGVLTENNYIMVDKNQQTNIEGVFAAGDCTGGFKQIATAVGQGAVAGKRIVDFVRGK